MILKFQKVLLKIFKRSEFKLRMNACFEEVVKNCASSSNRKQIGTWINQSIVESYCELHKIDKAYSVECFKDEKLVGGLYGVSVNGMLSGEIYVL